MGANFTPSWNSYSDVKPFRFWCQKVLPTVYDDALSYYELLCKVIAFLNQMLEDLEKVEANTDALLVAYQQLQDYVNHYFDSLNVQSMVDAALDEMAESGDLERLVKPYFDAWIEEAEAWAKGTKNGEAVSDDDPQYHNNAKYYAEQASGAISAASGYAEESEAWARGTVNGTPVASDADQYENNSKYYAEQAAQAAQNATYANEAQAWATGEVNGTPVSSDADQYENNAKYYAEQAAQAAQDATYSNEAQAWATGEVNGTPVASDADQYENNAKYYAQQAASAATNAVNTALSTVNTQLTTLKEVALEGVAMVTVTGVEVKASRTLLNGGQTQGTLNIPGLICVTMPYSDAGTHMSDTVDSNTNVTMYKKAAYIFDVQATGTNMLRNNKYLIQELYDGYSNATIDNGVYYDNHFFTVWDYTAGDWAADGTTINLAMLVGKIRYNDGGTAINTANVGN